MQVIPMRAKEGKAVEMVCVKVLYYNILPENQIIFFNKICIQLNQVKATTDKNHWEIIKIKSVILTVCDFSDIKMI